MNNPVLSMRAPKGAERRTAKRKSVIDEQILTADLGPYSGALVLDVSEGGMSVQAVSGPRKGEQTSVTFDLPGTGKQVITDGMVQWTEASGRLGLKFLKLDPVVQAHLREWIEAEHVLDVPDLPGADPAIEAVLAADFWDPAEPADIPTALSLIAEQITWSTRASGAAIALEGPDGMLCRASYGNAPAVGVQVKGASGLSGECLRTCAPVRCIDSEVDPRVDRLACRQVKVRSITIVPVHRHGRAIGLLEVFSPDAHAFGHSEVAMLTKAADMVAEIGPLQVVEEPPKTEPVVKPAAVVKPVPPPAAPLPAAAPSPKPSPAVSVTPPVRQPAAQPDRPIINSSPAAPPATVVRPAPVVAPIASATSIFSAPVVPPAKVEPVVKTPTVEVPEPVKVPAPAPAVVAAPVVIPAPPSKQEDVPAAAAKKKDRDKDKEKPQKKSETPVVAANSSAAAAAVKMARIAEPVAPVREVTKPAVAIAVEQSAGVLAEEDATETTSDVEPSGSGRRFAMAAAAVVVVAGVTFGTWELARRPKTATPPPAPAVASTAAPAADQPGTVAPGVAANTQNGNAAPAGTAVAPNHQSDKAPVAAPPAKAEAPAPSNAQQPFLVPRNAEARVSPTAAELVPPSVNIPGPNSNAIGRILTAREISVKPGEPVRVSEGVTGGNILSRVEPSYPAIARNSRIGGSVVLTVHVDKRGRVAGVKVDSGLPMLTEACIQAVRRWKFQPFELNGEPIENDTRVTFHFAVPR